MQRKERNILRDQIRSRLNAVETFAKHAQRLSLDNENLPDMVDDIYAELHWVVELLNKARGIDEKGGDA